MVHTKTHEELTKELKEAQRLIKIGGIYSHSKHPENLYQVIDLGFQEATDKICVIYQNQYGRKFTFVRDLDDWLKEVEIDGKVLPRFKLI